MTTRRVVFNLNDFLEELQLAIIDKHDMIDEVADRYKRFLFRADHSIRTKSMCYVNKHSLLTNNEKLKSYIDSFHRSFF